MTPLPAEMYYQISVVRALELVILLGGVICPCGILFCIMFMLEKPEYKKTCIKAIVALVILTFIFILAWIFIPSVDFIRAYYGAK